MFYSLEQMENIKAERREKIMNFFLLSVFTIITIICFSFLFLRAIDKESQYYYVYDHETQTYFLSEKGV
jgi:hypothetical protein